MGYIETTLTGDEKIEYMFSYHWIDLIGPIIFCSTILFSPIGIFLLLRLKFLEQGVTTLRGIKKLVLLVEKLKNYY